MHPEKEQITVYVINESVDQYIYLWAQSEALVIAPRTTLELKTSGSVPIVRIVKAEKKGE